MPSFAALRTLSCNCSSISCCALSPNWEHPNFSSISSPSVMIQLWYIDSTNYVGTCLTFCSSLSSLSSVLDASIARLFLALAASNIIILPYAMDWKTRLPMIWHEMSYITIFQGMLSRCELDSWRIFKSMSVKMLFAHVIQVSLNMPLYTWGGLRLVTLRLGEAFTISSNSLFDTKLVSAPGSAILFWDYLRLYNRCFKKWWFYCIWSSRYSHNFVILLALLYDWGTFEGITTSIFAFFAAQYSWRTYSSRVSSNFGQSQMEGFPSLLRQLSF